MEGVGPNATLEFQKTKINARTNFLIFSMHELFYRTGTQGLAHVHMLEHDGLIFVHYLLMFLDGTISDGHFELAATGKPRDVFENWRKKQPGPSLWTTINQQQFCSIKDAWSEQRVTN